MVSQSLGSKPSNWLPPRQTRGETSGCGVVTGCRVYPIVKDDCHGKNRDLRGCWEPSNSTCRSYHANNLQLQQFLLNFEMTLMLFSGAWGRWFMKKTWSNKSRDTVPLISAIKQIKGCTMIKCSYFPMFSPALCGTTWHLLSLTLVLQVAC